MSNMCHNVSEELSYDAYTESLDLINKNRVQIKMSKNSNMPFTVPAKWIAYFYIEHSCIKFIYSAKQNAVQRWNLKSRL